MKYITYIEIVVGLGLGIGPLVGAALYGPLEYSGTMYFFGGLNIFTMVMCAIFIPKSLNETATREEVFELDNKVQGIEDILEEIRP